MLLLHSGPFRRLFLTAVLYDCGGPYTVQEGPGWPTVRDAYKQTPFRSRVLQCSDRPYWGHFDRNFQIRRHGLYFFWIRLQIRAFYASRPVLLSASFCSWPVSILASVFPRETSIASRQSFVPYSQASILQTRASIGTFISSIISSWLAFISASSHFIMYSIFCAMTI
jgi:hypothetical protein